jgi:hypothetical protein
MARSQTPDDDASLPEIQPDEGGYDPPGELGDDGGGPWRSRSLALKLALGAAVVLAVAGGLLAYRAHHRRTVIATALSQADALLRLDTAAGYRQAADLLEPIAQLDALQGGSVRAFALAMTFADYRRPEAEREAEDLLVAPGRAEVVPSYAQLAGAALALGRREIGTATSALARAGDGPWPLALQARTALLAGNVEAALQPAASAAAEGAFPPGLALHGDTLRRLRRDAPAARAAYEAALAASPGQARSAYGLAKLALAGHAPAEEAESALRRLMEDREGTPSNERGRAAVHYAALRLRAGDRAGALATLDALGLDAPARAWAERAAIVASEQRGPYRAVQGAPASLQSASDDDPPELSPNPPPPPPPAPAPAAKAAVKKGAPKAALKGASKKGGSKSAVKASSKKAAKKSAKKAAAKKKVQQ